MRISDWSSDVCSSDLDALDRATDVSEDFILGKRQAARYFFDWELPKINHWLAILERLDSTALEMQDSWRSEERRVGKECVSTCRSRWWRHTSQKKQQSRTQL